jgi:cellulose synthase/poly-beta-1,6-N-acetylglucosamine synthase-like glycosyltransferase
MTILTGALAMLTAYYLFFVGRVVVGLRRLLHPERSDAIPSVTVIIAARNEEDTIASCVRSVLAQDYPQDVLKLIVVDDASTDRTSEIVQALALADGRLSCISLPPRPETGIGGKPEAIRTGVEAASSEIILTTDADCQHGAGWVRSMISHFTPMTSLVAGPVDLMPTSALFSRIERLDFLGLVISGAGLIGARRPIICNGANLAYRRSVYLEASDLVQRSSNDDGTLMSRIVTRRLGDVGFALAPDAVVSTRGQGSLRAFFRQRRRWAAVTGRFLDPTIYLELTLLFSFFAVLLASTVLSLQNPALRWPVVGAWALKFALDLVPLRTALRALSIERRTIDIFLAELFHPFSIVIATILSVVAPFRWKERTLIR